ncbi:MAG: hypothetical protein IJS51_08395 [Treponema sp.]|nr:hypothetical protein [Treponema sp.]
MKKHTLVAAFFVMATLTRAFAQLPPSFSSEWGDVEKNGLQEGKIIIRNIQRCKNISIQKGLNPCVDKVIDVAEKIDANYLAEIIYKMPKKRKRKRNRPSGFNF